MAATTLYQYYTQKQGSFPAYNSPQRLADAKSAGIANYEGTGTQNDILLAYLLKQGQTISPPTSTTDPTKLTVKTAPISATAPKEGDTRINTQTGQREFFNPEGKWVPVTDPEQVKPTGIQPKPTGGGEATKSDPTKLTVGITPEGTIQPISPTAEPAPAPDPATKQIKPIAPDSTDPTKLTVGLVDVPKTEVKTEGQPTPVTNPSIIDFLDSIKFPSDYTTRSNLAREYGITGYIGSGPQNERLLALIRADYDAGTFRTQQEEQPPAKATEEPKPGGTPTGGTDTGATGETPTDAIVQDNLEKENNINNEANADQENELEIIEDEAGDDVDFSKSEELINKMIDLLEESRQAETKSLQQQFLDQRKELGIGELEQSLAQSDQSIKQLDADFASTIEGEEARKVSVFQIRRRQSAQEIAYNRARRDLVTERDSVANQLNMKYGVLNTMVKLAGMDIDNAQQDYQFQFNAAMGLANAIRGIEDSAKTDEERKIDNARANVQIMYNLIKSGNIKYDLLDPSTLSDIKNMEIQSGFPIGFVKFINETIDDPITTFLTQFTDKDGNRIQPVGTIAEDGSFQIHNVKIGSAKVAGDDDVVTERQSRSTANTLLNREAGADGYVSPDSYNRIKNAWRADGLLGIDFDKAFGDTFTNPSHREDYKLEF